MALNNNLLSGLSNATASQSVRSRTNPNYSDTSSAQEKYEAYKNENTGLSSKDQFKFPLDTPKYKTVLVGREYVVGTTTTLIQKNTGSALVGAGIAKQLFVLPMPSESPIVDTYQITYDDNFSFLGALADAFGVGRGAQRVATYFGFNLNKQKTVLLESPMLKRHEFRWKLSPKNKNESDALKKMIDNLKIGMAPPVVQNTLSAIIKFPYIYDVYFEPNSKWLYPLKPCVIESISVNFSGNGQVPAFLRGQGAPESVMLTLNLLEIEFWVRQDYERWTKDSNPVDTLSKFDNTFSAAQDETFYDSLPGPVGAGSDAQATRNSNIGRQPSPDAANTRRPPSR